MSHFLQLEKGHGNGAATRTRRVAPSLPADADPQYLYLMLPEGNGFRVLRAALEEVEEVPAGKKPREEDPARIRFGDVEIDVSAREIFRKGEVVPLAPLEFDLLLKLAEHRGAAVSRAVLLRDVWGPEARVAARTIDTKIAMLRRKLEADPARPVHILTVSKVGYRLRV
jgi:DNA-binding response OmpR family regulator